jgi:hypothetical protein
MARVTIASLQAEIAVLRAQLQARTPSAVRKDARTLYVNGHPRVTYFKASEAYKGMRAAQARGHRAVYVPA